MANSLVYPPLYMTVEMFGPDGKRYNFEMCRSKIQRQPAAGQSSLFSNHGLEELTVGKGKATPPMMAHRVLMKIIVKSVVVA